MVLEGKIATMLYKLGKDYTFYRRLGATSSDDFYKDESVTWTSVTVKAVVFPARAYDVHANVLHYERSTGIDSVGIIDVFVKQADCTIEIDDYILIGSNYYKLKAKEIFGDAYYILEGHLDTRSS